MRMIETNVLEVTETSRGDFKLTQRGYGVSSLLPVCWDYVVSLDEKELVVRENEDMAREFYYGFLRGMEFFSKG